MKIFKAVTLVFLLIFIILFCLFSSEVAETFVNTAVVCVKNIIPTIFPTLTVALIIINANLVEILPQRMRFFALFLLSNVSGYPVGAKLLDSYCERQFIKKENASLLLPAFINAGPAFIINTIGIFIFNNKKLGLLLFVSQFIASFVIFVLLGGFGCYAKTKSIALKLTTIINTSVSESINAIKNICTYLILISCISKIGEIIFGNNAVKIFAAVCEITSAVFAQKNIYAVCILLSYGGLCVYMQIFSLVKNYKINFIELLLWRAFHTVIAFGVLKFIIKAFKITLPVFSNTEQKLIPTQNSGIFFCLFLIFTLICFMLSIKRKSSGNLAKDLI